MRLQPLTLSAEKAKKELKRFTIAAIVLSALGLFAFWFLGIVGLAFGARALVLSYHTANKKEKDTTGLRVLAILAIAIGLFDTIGGLAG